MPHYYLNIHNGHGDTIDEEGADFVDLEAARCHAIYGIRCFLSAELLEGLVDLTGHLDIVDQQGVVQATVPFTQAVTIRRP